MKIGWLIFFTWLVIVPAVIAIVGWANPLVGFLALLYSLVQATIKGLRLMGKWKRSPREIAQDEEQGRMRHHHYHCELNPEGFHRLMLENFEKEQREAIRSEAEILKRKQNSTK